jgi:uncharacterized protein YijF (DUF1287 family)
LVRPTQHVAEQKPQAGVTTIRRETGPGRAGMKKSSQRKSANRQKRRQNAERQSAAAAPRRAHPRQGHAGRVSTSRGVAGWAAAGRGALAGGGMAWRLPSFAFSEASLDRTWQRLGRAVPGRAIAASIPREDRETLALLLTPFLVLAALIAMSLGVQLERSVRSIAMRPSAPVASPLRGLPRVALAPVRDAAVIAAVEPMRQQARAVDGAGVARTGVSPLAPAASLAAVGAPDVVATFGAPASTALVRSGSEYVEPAAPARSPALVATHGGVSAAARQAPAPGLLEAHRAERVLAPVAAARDELAALDPRSLPVVPSLEQDAGPAGIAGVPGADTEDPRCVVAAAPVASSAVGLPVLSGGTAPEGIAAPAQAVQSRADFGRRLAVAALGQLDQFVIYNDAYRRLSYPGGDVPKLYGVCTDVVIRAYRALGVDLQVAVQRSGVGAGDPSIDHRRTETLRRFFARAGKSLPVTSFAEDYEPGDIVTYDRPQNSGSRSHIAVVSDMLSPAGRPMIIHNRGWGPQLEDGLFVDRITGHYRFDGAMPSAPAVHAALAGSLPARRASGLKGGLPVAGGTPGQRPAMRGPAPRRHALRSASAANNGSARTTAQR